jgi:hypothetical protein
MPIQSIYVHGNTVTMRFPGGKGDPVGSPHTPSHQMNGATDPETRIPVEWSDIVGLRGLQGVTFRGRSGQTNAFYAVISTPVYRDENAALRGDEVRARLARVGVKFNATSGVNITGMRIADGARQIPFPFPPMSLGGDHSLTWDQNVNYFDHPAPPAIESCVCVEFQVRFSSEGNITFSAVGCDFVV